MPILSLSKLFTLILLIITSVLIAAVFGILHDQVTYTISPEYYTKFKFHQFRLYDGNVLIFGSNRIAAGYVGLLATWWMGLFIGSILGAIGLIHTSWKKMFVITLQASLIVIALTVVVDILAFFYTKLMLGDASISDYGTWYFPAGLNDEHSYITVGIIHNCSYIGGLSGMIVAAIYSVRKKSSQHRCSRCSARHLE